MASRARSSSCRSSAREESLGEALQLRAGGEQVADERGGGDGRPERVEERGELLGRGELALEPGFVGTQAGGGAEGAASLAHEAGPQREPTGLVGGGAGGDRGHELVDLCGGQRRPCEAHPQADVVTERAAPTFERPPQELTHTGVALEPPHVHGLLDAHLCLGRDVGDGGLDDCLLAERGEDLGDVAQEGPARAEHEDAVPAERRVVVEEEGGAVEADGRLARAGASLDGEQLVQRGTDDLVLLGLDGGDDVEHLARAGPFELGQERVAATQPSGAGVVVTAAEQVVGHGDDRAAVHHDLAAPGEPQGILRAGPVEGDRDGGPPVHDDGIGPDVLDVAASDVPGRTLVLVDAPEEEGPGAVRQEVDPPREGRHVIEVGVPGCDQILEETLGALTHGRERLQGVLEVGLLGLQLRIGEWRRPAHRNRTRPKSRANCERAKIPGHSGDSTWIFRLLQAL